MGASPWLWVYGASHDCGRSALARERSARRSVDWLPLCVVQALEHEAKGDAAGT